MIGSRTGGGGGASGSGGGGGGGEGERSTRCLIVIVSRAIGGGDGLGLGGLRRRITNSSVSRATSCGGRLRSRGGPLLFSLIVIRSRDGE